MSIAREECPTRAKNLGGDDRYGALRILRRAVDILRERNDELAKRKPSTPEKRIRKPQPSISLPRGRARVLRRADPVAGRQPDPLRETSFVYTRREPLGVVAGMAHGTTRSRLPCGNPHRRWRRQRDDFQTERSHPAYRVKAGEIYSEAGLPDGVFNVLPGVVRKPGSI